MSPMDLVRRRRSAPAGPTSDSASASASTLGPAAPTIAERVVARTSGILSGGHSRRGFLARTAVVGSALAVDPMAFIFKPGTAYGALCGTCGDGWTAFCCTINGGRNSCPSGSFVAGWWKADNAAYCCGGPRYIIDCNATCPTQCSCRCSGASCDGRRTCCNQFRYGQCNQQISCYGPVVCRVAICITPWAYDAACSTRTLTDNRTSGHGAACLSDECDSAITRRYYALGGPAGFLGIRTTVERTTPEGRGRVASYQGGRLYSTSAIGAREVHGAILYVYGASGASGGAYGFPTTDELGDSRVRFSLFERGGIYFSRYGTIGVPEPYHSVYSRVGGIAPMGILGLPTAAIRRSADGRSLYINFERGRIYRRNTSVVEIHGAIFGKHEELGGVHGPLGYPQTDVGTLADGRGRASIFENGGVIYYNYATGTAALWGGVLEGYLNYGGYQSDAGYPTTSRRDVGDGRGTYAITETARIYATPQTGGHLVPKQLLGQYLTKGGPTGSLGYPTARAQRSSSGVVSQTFERGTLSGP